MARILKNGVEYGVGGQTLTERITAYTNERAKLCFRGYGGRHYIDKPYTNKKITFSEITSVDASLISVQGTRLVSQKKGNYLISISALWDTKSTNKINFSGFISNGSNWLGAINSAITFFPSGNYTANQTNTQAIYMNKGDYIEPVVQSNIAGGTCNEFRITIVYVGGEQ